MQIEHLALDVLRPSPTNPRKKFDPAALDELAESIRNQGLAQPIIVRAIPVEPLKGGILTEEMKAALTKQYYEIIAGERRWRAAKIAGLKEVPCIPRVMNDREALELQLIENLQRRDLSALEEAAGLHAMLQLTNDDGTKTYTHESLAVKLGKAKSTVGRMIKLVTLPEAAREALETGGLPTQVALLIAQVPGQEARERLTAEVLKPEFQSDALNYRETADLIAEDYSVSLAMARFDRKDGQLVSAAGPCTTCPKRSGNMDPDLKGRSQDTCTDIDCFKAKNEAAFEAWRMKNTDPARNRRALTRQEAKKIGAWNSGYVELNKKPEMDLCKRGTEEKDLRPWSTLIKGRGVEVLVALREHDQFEIEAVDRKLAIEAAKLNEYTFFRDEAGEKKSTGGAGAGRYDFEAEQKKRAEKIRRMEPVVSAIYNALMPVAEKMTLAQFAVVAGSLQYTHQHYSHKRRGWKTAKQAEAGLAALSEVKLKAYLVDIQLSDLLEYEGGLDQRTLFFCKLFKIDAKAIEKKVLADETVRLLKIEAEKLKAKAAAKKSPEAKAATKQAGSLGEKIVRLLTAAGDAGMTVKDMAAGLKVKPGSVLAWFYTAGKKVAGLHQVGAAKYSYRNPRAESQPAPAAVKPAKAEKAVAK